MTAIRTLALSWLRTAIGNPTFDFRDGQWDAINQLVTRRGRVLCVQPTGWGKSMVNSIAVKVMRAQDTEAAVKPTAKCGRKTKAADDTHGDLFA